MLSNTCKYGIRAIIYLARNGRKGEKIGIKTISGDLDLPMPFLAKILQSLAKKKILVSSKGPNGGFALARKAGEIYLADVARAIDGEDVFSRCVLHNENCTSTDSSKTPCTMHYDYVKARKKIEKLFESKTVQQLVSNSKQNDVLI
jgi:Rrf2 family protein